MPKAIVFVADLFYVLFSNTNYFLEWQYWKKYISTSGIYKYYCDKRFIVNVSFYNVVSATVIRIAINALFNIWHYKY